MWPRPLRSHLTDLKILPGSSHFPGNNEELLLFAFAGRTTLGSDGTDIPLQGPGVSPQHCYIENQAGSITLHPCGNQCSVDGLPVTKPHRLTQGSTFRDEQLWLYRISARPGSFLWRINHKTAERAPPPSAPPSLRTSSSCRMSFEAGVCGDSSCWRRRTLQALLSYKRDDNDALKERRKLFPGEGSIGALDSKGFQ